MIVDDRSRTMGRISVDFVVANHRDVVTANPGDAIPDAVKHITLHGIVDTGSARLVLPQRAADELGLEQAGEVSVRYADNCRANRPRVTNVWLKLCGRDGVFSATVDPNRDEALIGAIVLEELDLIVDCATESVHPRDPDRVVTEIG
jgi:predicted aspartyl protease